MYLCCKGMRVRFYLCSTGIFFNIPLHGVRLTKKINFAKRKIR